MQANFVSDLGEKAQVPIVSFSATSPSLTSLRSPYFFRVAQNDSSQVKAISAIVQAFGWREVVPIYVDNAYGEGIIPFLIDALQNVDARAPYRSVISPSATDDQIVQELYKLMTMQTRVFIVHMSTNLSSRLFHKAKEIGMMKPAVLDSMQGVLGVKTYVPKTKELENFTIRWKRKFQEDNPTTVNGELNVIGLWAYDTASALARVVREGYCIDIFNAVMESLPYAVSYEFIPFAKPNGGPTGTYNDLVYQVFLGGEIMISNLARFVVIIWVFVVLILTQSYTASLTSLLTVQQLQPTVTDVNQLIKNGEYVGYQGGSFVLGILKEKKFDETKLIIYDTAEECDQLLSKGSADGGIAAAIIEIPYMKLFLAQYCSKYTMVESIYKIDGFGFVFPIGSPLVSDVSRAVLNVTEGEKMKEIENEWLRKKNNCPDSNNQVQMKPHQKLSTRQVHQAIQLTQNPTLVTWKLQKRLQENPAIPVQMVKNRNSHNLSSELAAKI
uniref:Ionotropic glutamate receptor C-terminal domain-containing protein n=1 Tax=Fagus sylvatica TaxID=28930 RepID=A0A2N9ELZ8_FAGSY